MVLASARLPLEESCAGGHAACIQPPAARVAPAQWHAAAIPFAVIVDEDECAIPRATCIQPPAASVIVPRFVAPLALTTSVPTVLAQWERSSAARTPVSDRDRSWLSRRNEPTLSAHAVETAVRLLGPIQATALAAEFAWTLESSPVGIVVLHGVPREDAARMFCPRIRVQFDVLTGGVTDVELGSRDGGWVAVKLPDPRDADAPTIQLASFEVPDTGLPLPPSPAPQRLVVDSEDRPVAR
jgi:hypothetical protein